MTLELYISPLTYQTLCSFAYLLVLTLMRGVFSKYSEERYANASITIFSCSLIVSTLNFLSVLGLDIEEALVHAIFTYENGTIVLFKILTACGYLYITWETVWLPIHRALFETDEAKDRRFGVVPIKKD